MIANRIAKINVLIAVVALLVVALIGVASLIFLVYIPQVNSQNTQITQQSHLIDGLNSTVSNLNSQVKDLQDKLSQYTASLNTALGVKDLVENNTGNHYLYIRGEVTNRGITAAYNAGLHVVGYGANHEVLINMTSPLYGGTYQNGFTSSTNLSQLYPTQTQACILSIYHQGNVVDYDITAVWTNVP